MHPLTTKFFISFTNMLCIPHQQLTLKIATLNQATRLADKLPIGRRFDCYFLPAAFLLAAHRAFISWESLFRPAGVSPPFFCATLLTPVRFRLAHRAFAASESFALVAADIFFSPVLNDERDKAVPRSEARRLSRASSWRRAKSASCKSLRDMSIRCQ
jgi:hypothetical protein